MLLKRLQIILGLAFQADHRKNGDGVPQRACVNIGMIGFDCTRLFKRAHTAQAGRSCQADLGGEFDIGYATVSLQFCQKLHIYRVKVRICHDLVISNSILPDAYNIIMWQCNCPITWHPQIDAVIGAIRR